MTLHPHADFTIPEETVRVTRAAYPHGNTLIKLRDAAADHLPGSSVCFTLSSQRASS